MPLILRRLLNYLPIPLGRDRLVIRSSWHKPTPFDQWRSQAPFRARSVLRTDHFGRGLRRRRLIRALLRWSIIAAVAWVLVESVRALSLF
jgi:hypothetical protein